MRIRYGWVMVAIGCSAPPRWCRASALYIYSFVIGLGAAAIALAFPPPEMRAPELRPA